MCLICSAMVVISHCSMVQAHTAQRPCDLQPGSTNAPRSRPVNAPWPSASRSRTSSAQQPRESTNSWHPPAQEYIQPITHPKQPMNISHQLQAKGGIWIQMSLSCQDVSNASAVLPRRRHIHSQWIPPEATCRLLSIYSSEKYFKILCFCTPLTIASVTRYSFSWTAETAEPTAPRKYSQNIGFRFI